MVVAPHEVERKHGWSRWAMPAAVGLTGLTATLVLSLAVLVATMPSVVPSDDVGPAQLIFIAPLLAMAAVGFLLATRRPANPVGWLLCSTAFVVGLLLVGSDYLDHWLYVPDLPAALVAPLSWLSNLGWAAGFPMLLVVLPLTFPDGNLLTKRWRVFVGLTAALVAATMLSAILDPQGLGDNHRFTHNPLGISGTHGLMSAISGVLYAVGLVALSAVGIAAVVIRYRRGEQELRRQLKWFLAAESVAVLTMVLGLATNFSPIGGIAAAIGFTLLPLSIGVAVLKYRLYNIDVVINRAVLFATMAGFIAVVYLAIVVGIGAVVGTRENSNLVLSVVATAIVGLAFQPVLGRAQRAANRLVYGKRATPYEVLSDLSRHLVDTFAGDDLLLRMARTLAEATGAAKVEVLLRVGQTMRSAAIWPAETPPSPATPVTGELADLPDFDVVIPVVHQTEFLGAFALAKHAREPLSPLEEKLVTDLAAQAGLMLKNMGLTADLQARLEDLRASRQRLVHAQDAERRRIERNLHDGAQQNLVALKVKLGLVEMLAKKDPDKAAVLANEVKADVDEALQTLRELARGIYPPLLAEQGLVAALQSQAGKATVPVAVHADGVLRYPPEVEAAVYFFCLEGLQNMAKYAAASEASIHVFGSLGQLEFCVQDNGAGFNPEITPRGSGFTNMADRIDALGGEFAVTSSPGAGTQVKGSLPVAGRE